MIPRERRPGAPQQAIVASLNGRCTEQAMWFGVLFVVAVLAAIAALSLWQRDRVKRALFLKRSGFAVMALSTLFFGTFLAGDTFADPGGWKAAGLVAAWLLPLAALGALAWYRPAWSVPVFAVLTAGVIGMSIWFAVNPEGWRSFENHNGPVRDVIIFVLAAAVAVLGLKRTAVAGTLLLIIGLIPIAISSLGSFSGLSSLAVVSSAPVVAGALYLLSARTRARPTPPARADSGPGELPKAA